MLVVGAANSGTDVALDAARAGHAVTLAGRHPGHVPFDIDTPINNLIGGLFVRYMRSITTDSARGRAMRAKELAHGVMLVRNTPADLARAGVVRVGRVAGVEAGRPVTADGTVIDAATVVWCTGSRPDLGWIDIAGVVGDDGLPIEHRGLASGCPGLAFVGMPFQYSVASSTLVGMDRDAAYRRGVARRGADRTDRRPHRTSPPESLAHQPEWPSRELSSSALRRQKARSRARMSALPPQMLRARKMTPVNLFPPSNGGAKFCRTVPGDPGHHIRRRTRETTYARHARRGCGERDGGVRCGIRTGRDRRTR